MSTTSDIELTENGWIATRDTVRGEEITITEEQAIWLRNNWLGTATPASEWEHGWTWKALSAGTKKGEIMCIEMFVVYKE